MAQKNKMLKMESIGRMAVSLCVCVCAVVRMNTLLPCAASLANNIYVYSGGENQMTQNIRRAPRRSTQVFVVVYSFMVFIDCGDEKQKEKKKSISYGLSVSPLSDTIDCHTLHNTRYVNESQLSIVVRVHFFRNLYYYYY